MGDPVPNISSSSLVWLSPDVAKQVAISRYLCFAIFGGWLCEFLMTIRRDVLIWKRVWSPLNDPFYVAARLTTLGFLLCGLAFQVLPIESCRALINAVQIFYSFALPMSTHLFFFRIKAIFGHSRPTIWFFFILRVLVSTGAIVQATGATGRHIGPTKQCILTQLQSYCSAGTLAVALNDTVVILAISSRLLLNSTADTWQARWRAFFRGKGMGQVSRILMRTGQQYYIATIGINICTAVVILIPSISPTTRELMYYFNIMIVNIMACRAFRQLRLEMMQDCVPAFSINLSGIEMDGGASRVGDLEWASSSVVRSGPTRHDSYIESTEGIATVEGDLEKGADVDTKSEDTQRSSTTRVAT